MDNSTIISVGILIVLILAVVIYLESYSRKIKIKTEIDKQKEKCQSEDSFIDYSKYIAPRYNLIKNAFPKGQKEYLLVSNDEKITFNGNRDVKYYIDCCKDNGNLYLISDYDSILSNAIKSSNAKMQIFYMKINVNDIQYYKVDGEVSTFTEITGGGNTGSDYGKAIVGGILAGAAGAIIASRPKTEPIKSVTTTIDDRYCYLVYYDSKRLLCNLRFSKEAKEQFDKIISEKDYNFIITQNKENPVKAKDNSSTKNRMLELNGLLKDGLITQEEFDEKKKKILEEM